MGVGALEKVKKGTGHRGETSRSKDVALGSLAVCTPHYVGVRGPGPGTPTLVSHLGFPPVIWS